MLAHLLYLAFGMVLGAGAMLMACVMVGASLARQAKRAEEQRSEVPEFRPNELLEFEGRGYTRTKRWAN